MRSSRPRMCGLGTHPGAAHVHGSRMMMSYAFASAESNPRSDVFTSSATPSSWKARSRQRRISTSPDAPPRRLSSSYELIESIVYNNAFFFARRGVEGGGVDGGGCGSAATTGGDGRGRVAAGVAGGLSSSGGGGGGGCAVLPCSCLQRCRRICFSSWFNAVSVSFIRAKCRKSILADGS